MKCFRNVTYVSKNEIFQTRDFSKIEMLQKRNVFKNEMFQKCDVLEM